MNPEELTLNELRKSKRLYSIWQGMKQRCNNPKSFGYKYYGAKGIKVCDLWLESFEEFSSWSFANGYTDTPKHFDDPIWGHSYKLTIDRMDPTKDYCPQNCRWIPLGLNSALSQAKKYGRSHAWCFEHWNDHHHITK